MPNRWLVSPERLAQLKAHILNPPSASLNRDWMLELVAALEARPSVSQIAVMAPNAPQSIRAVLDGIAEQPPKAVQTFGNIAPASPIVDALANVAADLAKPKKKGTK